MHTNCQTNDLVHVAFLCPAGASTRMSFVDFVSIAIQRASEATAHDEQGEYDTALGSYTQVHRPRRPPARRRGPDNWFPKCASQPPISAAQIIRGELLLL